MSAPTMLPLSRDELTAFIKSTLDEDVGPGDVTANSVLPDHARLTASANAREAMTVAGLPIAVEIFRALDDKAEIDLAVGDGAVVDAGDTLFTVNGKARALLTAERSALNVLQHLSGIATLTRQYVDAIEGTGAILLDTRKTIPGLRKLAKYATACGGAQNHRVGLYDAVMIKDNHLGVAGTVQNAVRRAFKAGETKVQVECDTLDQVREALEAGATSLLLDNMNLAMLEDAVTYVDGRIPLEASGGVTLKTIHNIAATGVDYVSVGRLTQSAPAVDIGLDFTSA